MTGDRAFRYDGKRALVVGGATGMGAAAAKIVRRPRGDGDRDGLRTGGYETDQAIEMDLRDPDSIDRAVDELPGPVDALFAAAGIADGPDLMRAVFIGHRHLIERLMAQDLLPRGSAICFISSVGGMGWENDLDRIQDFLATPDYDAADQWVKSHDGDGSIHYGFAKQVIGAYVALQGFEFLKKGVRVNAICPGPTDTPLARATPICGCPSVRTIAKRQAYRFTNPSRWATRWCFQTARRPAVSTGSHSSSTADTQWRHSPTRSRPARRSWIWSPAGSNC